MRKEATAVSKGDTGSDRRLYLVGSRPEVKGVEGTTPDGRPTFTIFYSQDHVHGPGRVVFRGGVARPAPRLTSLQDGEMVAESKIAADRRKVESYVGAINEGVRQAQLGVAVESHNRRFSLVPEDPHAIENESPLRGKLAFEITREGGRVVLLEGEEAQALDRVRRAEREGGSAELQGDERRLLQRTLRGTGIDLVVDRGQMGLVTLPGSSIEEVYTIDLDQSPSDKAASKQKNGVPHTSSPKEIIFDGTTASIVAAQADYAARTKEVPLITAREQEEYFPLVTTLPVPEVTLFQQWTLASVTSGAVKPEPPQEFIVPTHPLDGLPVEMRAGAGTSTRGRRPEKYGGRLDGLGEEVGRLRYARARRPDLGRIAAHVRLDGEEEKPLERPADVKNAFIKRAREVLAHPSLHRGAKPAELVEAFPERVIRYKDDRADQPIFYREILGDVVPKFTRAGRHRPWDIAAILTLMDYEGRLNPEQQRLVVEKAQITYEIVKKELDREKAQTTQDTERVIKATIEKKVWEVGKTIREHDALQGKTHVTAAEIVTAFPALKGFQDRFADIVPEPGAEGRYHPSVVVGLQILLFYGDRLYLSQQKTVFGMAQTRWDKWQAEEDGTATVKDKSIARKVLTFVDEVSGHEVLQGKTQVTAAQIVAAYPELDGFEEEYADVIGVPVDGVYPLAAVAAIRGLRFFGNKLNPDQREALPATAQEIVDRRQAEEDGTNGVKK